jgi:hypothetical protein
MPVPYPRNSFVHHTEQPVGWQVWIGAIGGSSFTAALLWNARTPERVPVMVYPTAAD